MIAYFWFCIALMIAVVVAVISYPLLKKRKPSFLAVGFIALLMSVLSLFLYYKMGSYQALKDYERIQQQTVDAKKIVSQLKSPQQLIDQLQAHLNADPNSAEGWFLLGKLYMDLGQPDKGLQALLRAHTLAPDNSDYTVTYIQADFQKNHYLSDADIALLAPLLKRDSNNVRVINLLAIDAYLQHHYRSAIIYWERLLAIFPADSNDSKIILQMIAKAQHELRGMKK